MELPVYKIQKTIPLRDEEYFHFLLAKIREAKHRVYASIFIINALQAEDIELKVRELAKSLAYAKWRNVDIKIIYGNSENSDIRVANETTAHYLKELGISVKEYQSEYRRSLHSKYVLIDDELIMLGSHNWSHGAFKEHKEDSIAVYSKELNIILNDEFHKLWNISKELEGLS